MLGFAEDQKNRRVPTNLIARCAISFVSASLAQFTLSMVPRFFPASSLPVLLSFSAIALLAMAGVGKLCKRLIRVRASAPALVFFNIAFVWGIYIGVVRRVISPLMDILLNAEFLMLMIGLCSILSTDPGYVTNESSNLNKLGGSSVSELVPSTCGIPCELATEDSSIPLQRVRYCSHCKKYVKGFDHHCPAFGNCIGQENHALFIILLFGFVVTEASYVTCSSQIRTEAQILYKTESQVHRCILYLHDSFQFWWNYYSMKNCLYARALLFSVKIALYVPD
ncbi:protein S-acyltransferase [Sarracenia purpurea var. burkii]